MNVVSKTHFLASKTHNLKFGIKKVLLCMPHECNDETIPLCACLLACFSPVIKLELEEMEAESENGKEKRTVNPILN